MILISTRVPEKKGVHRRTDEQTERQTDRQIIIIIQDKSHKVIWPQTRITKPVLWEPDTDKQ